MNSEQYIVAENVACDERRYLNFYIYDKHLLVAEVGGKLGTGGRLLGYGCVFIGFAAGIVGAVVISLGFYIRYLVKRRLRTTRIEQMREWSIEEIMEEEGVGAPITSVQFLQEDKKIRISVGGAEYTIKDDDLAQSIYDHVEAAR